MYSPPKLRIRDLQKSFGQKKVLDGLSFDLNAGESMVIIGGSGTGKSVLLRCILGLYKPDAGDIFIDEVNVAKLSAGQWQQHLESFGMLFQGAALFDSMKVWENIAFALIQGHGMPRAKAKKIALEKLAAVDLAMSVANLYPAELSGGMQKRVALARAIASEPQVIFFDEPTTGLDPIVSGTINDLIVASVKKLGATTLTITHDINSLRRIADRVGLLFEGKLIWMGTVAEMETTDNPYVQQFINGRAHGPFTD
ncbi:MAG: ATP-binding cassette domain-containing protein, partial [Alphaproteobacteria bacterium]